MGLLDDAIREHLDLKRRRGADPTEVERAEREALGPVRRGPEPESAEELAGGVEPAYDVESEQDWQEEPLGEEPDTFAPPAAPRRRFSPSEMFKRSAPPPAEEAPLSDEQSLYDEDHLYDDGLAAEAPLAEERSRSAEPARSHDPAPADDPAPPRFVSPREQGVDRLGEDPLGDPFADDPLGDPFAEDDHPGTPPPHPAPAAPPPPASAAPAPHPAEPAGGETVEYRIDEALEAEPKKKEGEDVLEETPEFLQDTPDHDRLWFEQRPPKDFDFDG